MQIDTMKGIAIIAVVLLHAAKPAAGQSLWVNFFAAQAVPVFFLIMAFNAQNSFAKSHARSSLISIYRSNYLWRRLVRLLVPVAVAFVAVAALGVYRGVPLSVGPMTLLASMPVPMRGQYFIAVSIMFVLLAPLLYVAYRRAPGLTVIGCVALDVAFELLAPSVSLFSTTRYFYQVTPFRFLALFALGAWLTGDATPLSRRNWFIAPYAALSVGLLLAYGAGFRPPSVGVEYTYHVASFGYPLLLVAAGLTYLPAYSTAMPVRFISELGRASYHIFLVQGIWFTGLVKPAAPGTQRWMILSVLLSCLVGWGWYRVGSILLHRQTARSDM